MLVSDMYHNILATVVINGGQTCSYMSKAFIHSNLLQYFVNIAGNGSCLLTVHGPLAVLAPTGVFLTCMPMQI